MKPKWLNIQFVMTMAVIAMTLVALLPGVGVREIRDGHRLANFALVDPHPGANDWPWHRGVNSQNVTSQDGFPKNWPNSNNRGWQTSVPGRCRATPTLWGDQLYLLTTELDQPRISLRSYNRSTGHELWNTELHQGGFRMPAGNAAVRSSTLVCDGHCLYAAAAARGKLWVSSVDMAGRIIWQREAGPYSSKDVYGASPALFKSLIIVAVDQKEDSYIAALHRQSGEVIWRVKRPDGRSAGSPIVANVAGKHQLVLAGKGTVNSYDPTTGDLIWTFRWSADRVSNSIAFDDQHVFVAVAKPRSEVVCINATGSGDVTDSHLVWRQTKMGSDAPSPVCRDGLLYLLSDDGLLRCFDAATGKIEWRRRLEGSFSASPVIAGENLICCSENGLTSILQTGLSNVVVAENQLTDGIMASPIVAGEAILLRTSSGLRCIVAPSAGPVVEETQPKKLRL